jgi:hypothetical protein
MTTQGVNITVQDNGLGQSPPGQGNTELVVGVSSSGTAYQPVTSTNPADFVAAGGYGPSVRLASFIVKQTGNPVTWVKCDTAAAGTVTTVYSTAGNTSGSAVTVSGTPNDDGYLVITVLVGGTIGTVGCQVGISTDGGATTAYTVNLGTSNTITTGSAFTSYTGLTINFGAGTLVLGDSWYAVMTAPTWAATAIQSAINAAAAIKAITFQDIMVAGVTAEADAVAFDGYMTTLANTAKRWSRLLCSARDAEWGGASAETQSVWMASLEVAWAVFESDRVSVSAGYYRFLDPFNGSQLRSSLLYGAAARDSAVAIQIDLGQVSSGALQNLVLPTAQDPFANGIQFYHDESVNPGLNAARFLAAWQLVGFPGVYIMNPNLMAAPGSDFNWLQHGHVIDAAATIAYVYWTQQLSSAVRVSKKTGFILPQDRSRLQNGCQAQLNNILVSPGAVSDATCVVSATDNILSTATLTVTISVVPLGYIKAVDVTITFLNPALVVVQQAA